jgi:hypothetical protein
MSYMRHTSAWTQKLTEACSGVIPCLVAASANAYWLWNAHWEHWSHMPPLEERTEYPYQNIRTKNFQWGDGDKVSPDATSWLKNETNVSIVNLVSLASAWPSFPSNQDKRTHKSIGLVNNANSPQLE